MNKHRCLLIEFWGLGDMTMLTAALQQILSAGWEVTIAGKPHGRLLLESAYSDFRWIDFTPPWTAFRGKYRLWRWPWGNLLNLIWRLRNCRFEAALSVRRDPRDHFFMWLIGAKRRIGFKTRLSWPFLNESLVISEEAHKVEDWWNLQDKLLRTKTQHVSPKLLPDADLAARYREKINANGRAIIALHCGAAQKVRRWPEPYFRELIIRLRKELDFLLLLFPDLDGYGAGLKSLADYTFESTNVAQLLAILSCADVLIANDSGPAHVAAALGLSVVTIFGPGEAKWFRPFGEQNLVVIRDICPYRPCFDYCRFPEPYCLTKLMPTEASEEIVGFLRSRLVCSANRNDLF
ncbi:MAG: glycosyltransferase family 9 protein [Verrucomicrobia bacterium]|nr:glycosyltransferase family 9 protein [Verrucomicrobiota bacterium]